MLLHSVILSLPTADSPGTTICAHTESSTYLFGQFPEGLQRVAGRSKGIPWTRPDQHLFLSGTTKWSSIAGLPGYLLTLAGVSEAHINAVKAANAEQPARARKPTPTPFNIPLHGADNLSHALAALRVTILRQTVQVRIHETTAEQSKEKPTHGRAPDWEDKQLRVWKVPVRRDAPTGSPWKRLASGSVSPRGSGSRSRSHSPVRKPRTGPAGPSLAKHIVERGMFDGEGKLDVYLKKKRVQDLEPGEMAWRQDPIDFEPYDAGDEEKALKPHQQVWVHSPRNDGTGSLNLKNQELPSTTYGEVSMCYVFKSQPSRGKFNPEAALALGVEKRQFKLLTQGIAVAGKDGKMVTPEQVLGGTVQGNGVIVADISTSDLIDPFLERPEWTDESLMSGIVVVYWILGKGLSANVKLIEFMRDRPALQHVICSPETSPNRIVLGSNAELGLQLHRVDPERFPLLHFDNKAPATVPVSEGSSILAGKFQQRIALMPRIEQVEDDLPGPDMVAAANAVPEEILDLAKEAKKRAEDPEFLAGVKKLEADFPNRDAEVVCLGTSSSQPTAHRNLCGTLIKVPGIGNYILDAGEGTLGQIRRLYGPEETAKILAELRGIVISHVHADHMLGVPSIVTAWYEQAQKEGNRDKLAIICIPRVEMMYKELAQVEDIGLHRLEFPLRSIYTKRGVDTYEKQMNGDFGLNSILRTRVEHCWESFGTQLELTSGLRIAWSGDCRPSFNFAEDCKGAHLLIHECTFGADEQEHAKAKNHSTIEEALAVAKKMQARRVLLTHFSARYKAVLRGLADQKDGGMPVLPARDFMTVKLGDFQKAAIYTPVVEKLAAIVLE